MYEQQPCEECLGLSLVCAIFFVFLTFFELLVHMYSFMHGT